MAFIIKCRSFSLIFFLNLNCILRLVKLSLQITDPHSVLDLIFHFDILQTMKEMIYNSVEEAPSAEGLSRQTHLLNTRDFVIFLAFFLLATDQELISRYFAKVEENFFQYSDKELLKINTFFSGKRYALSKKIKNYKKSWNRPNVKT